jgi:hypothetical protein
LYNRIERSRDKLFIIKHTPTGQVSPTWYVVQVDLDETDPIAAKDWGVYRARWYIRHHRDSKKNLHCNCRFWPEIHELNSDNSFGPVYPVGPEKAEAFVVKHSNRYGWYQLDVNIAEAGLVGPFDFDKEYHIPNAAWDQLRIKAAEQNLNIANAFEICPL